MINTAVPPSSSMQEPLFSPFFLQRWLITARLRGDEVDSITAVMLKILDGKCKMPTIEKQIMESLYDCARELSGKCLGHNYHQLIERARASCDEQLIEHIYETRVLAETQISRPIMKKFKARLRDEGILPQKILGISDHD